MGPDNPVWDVAVERVNLSHLKTLTSAFVLHSYAYDALFKLRLILVISVLFQRQTSFRILAQQPLTFCLVSGPHGKIKYDVLAVFTTA